MTSSAGRDRQSFNMKNHRCKKSTVLETFWPCWQEIHRHPPLFIWSAGKNQALFIVVVTFWSNEPILTIIAWKIYRYLPLSALLAKNPLCSPNDHSPDWPLLQESTVVSTAGKNTGLYTVYQRCCKNATVIHRWLEEICHQAPTNLFEEKQEKNWIRGRFCPYVSKENPAKPRGFLFKSEARPDPWRGLVFGPNAPRPGITDFRRTFSCFFPAL